MRSRIHRSERGFLGGPGESLLISFLAAAVGLGLVLIVVRAVYGERVLLVVFGTLLTLCVVLNVAAGLVDRYARSPGGGGLETERRLLEAAEGLADDAGTVRTATMADADTLARLQWERTAYFSLDQGRPYRGYRSFERSFRRWLARALVSDAGDVLVLVHEESVIAWAGIDRTVATNRPARAWPGAAPRRA